MTMLVDIAIYLENSLQKISDGISPVQWYHQWLSQNYLVNKKNQKFLIFKNMQVRLIF